MRKSILILISLLGFGQTAAQAGHSVTVASCPPGKDPHIETMSGLFIVHVVCDRVHFEIPPDMLNRDILANTEFAALSTGTDFVAPGSVVDNRVIRFTRLGNKVYLENVRYEILARQRPDLQRGAEAASLHTVLRGFDVIREGANGAPVIDITGVLTTEVPAEFALDLMRDFRMRHVDPERSYIRTVKAFPEHIDVEFYQTWVPDPNELFKSSESGENRAAALGFIFHMSIHLLPKEPMRGRYWDARVGFFNVSFDDFGSGENGKVRRAYIERFRLEKKDIRAEVSDPVRPIVFFISEEVPREWRPYVKRGIEDWQPLFEKAGFRNAIIARDAPTLEKDPHWHPEDVRTNVVRWTPSGRQDATGPAVIDPRSGEVISSHVILWHDVLRLIETWYFTQVSPLDPRGRQLPLPQEIIGELLRYVVSHEIGHSLGLRHNFKGHSAYSVARLRSKEWTQRWGNSASIMDYSRLNYVAQPGDNAYLLPRFGPYDYFAIEWGYGQFTRTGMQEGNVVTEVASTDAEMELLDKLAAKQVDDPLLRFGGEDSSANLDPTVNTNVIGSDPIGAADYGLRNVDRVMPYLISGTTRLGGDYARSKEVYEALIQHRHRQLSAVAKLVGGVEETRYHAGRGGEPFKAVPASRQRAAVKFLLDRGFAVPRALLDKAVLTRIAPSGGADGLQGSNVKLLRQLLSDSVFQRMAEAQSLEPAAMHYTGIEMLRDLNNGLFEELASARPVTELYRRELQRNYVTLLLVAAGAMNDPESTSRDIESISPSVRENAKEPHHQAKRSAASPLPEVAQQYRAGNLPSEARTMLLTGIYHLHDKISAIIGKARDPVTAAHLRSLEMRLARALR